MSHEQSETVQMPNGDWVNVYGMGTERAGQILPGTTPYKSMHEAVSAAQERSKSFDHPHQGVVDAMMASDPKLARDQAKIKSYQDRATEGQSIRTENADKHLMEFLDRFMPMPPDAPHVPPLQQGMPLPGPRLQDIINPTKVPSPNPAQPVVPIIGTRG